MSFFSRTSVVVISIIVAVIILAAAVFWFLYDSFEKPRVISVVNTLTVPDNGNMDISTRLEVYNPNGFNLQVDSLDYEIYIEGEKYLSGKKSEPVFLPASDTGHFTLPLQFRSEEFSKDLKERDYANHRIVVKGYLSGLKIQPMEVELTYEKSLPVIKQLSASLQGVEIKDFSLSDPQLNARMQLHNPNVYDFDIVNMSYELKVEGEQWMQGEKKEPFELKPKSTHLIELPFTLHNNQLKKSAVDFIKGNKVQLYTLSINFNVENSDSKFPDTRVQINKSDTLKLLNGSGLN